MNQNLATLVLTPEQLTTAITAVGALESVFGELISLTAAERRKAITMGEKSEMFCRQTLNILQQHPQCLTGHVDLADALADLAAVDQLRPLLARVAHLYNRLVDTDLALRSDVMAVALQGYRLLKVAGRNTGMEPFQRELATRFARKRPVAKEKTAR